MSLALKMRSSSYEQSVTIELSTWDHITEDWNLHQYYRKYLKSHTVNIRIYSFHLHIYVLPNLTVKC
jgi:hypothetical protein